MVNLIQIIQLVSVAALGVTLFALFDGLLAAEPAAISVALSLLAQVGGLISSSPLVKKTTVEDNVIQHLKGSKNVEREDEFESFLRDMISGQHVERLYDDLVSRKIVSRKMVRKGDAVFPEVRLTRRARLL